MMSCMYTPDAGTLFFFYSLQKVRFHWLKIAKVCICVFHRFWNIYMQKYWFCCFFNTWSWTPVNYVSNIASLSNWNSTLLQFIRLWLSLKECTYLTNLSNKQSFSHVLFNIGLISNYCWTYHTLVLFMLAVFLPVLQCYMYTYVLFMMINK